MPAKINLINNTFGNLTVIKETSERRNNSVVWQCQCKCGNMCKYTTHQLRSEGVLSCSQCKVKRNPSNNLRENIIGKVFNNLTVLEPTSQRSGGKIVYKCICNCEMHNLVFTTKTDLESGHTKSCGCIKLKYHIGDIINNRIILKENNQKNSLNQHFYKCKCLLCDREYEATANTLQHTFSCGCQKSRGEFNIINILKNNNIKYIKEYCLPNSLLRYDFALLNENDEVIRLIEFDGEQHFKEGIRESGWNTKEKYEYTKKNDEKKNELAKQYNIPLIRISYKDRDNITLNMLIGDTYKII